MIIKIGSFDAMKPSFRWLLFAVFSLLFIHSASAHYNPRLGRWLTRDPIGEEGGFNRYAYCGNDPVNRWDYLGLATEEERKAAALNFFSEMKAWEDVARQGRLNELYSYSNYDARVKYQSIQSSAKDKISDMWHRWDILTRGTESNYQALVRESYGINSSQFWEIMRFYADQFNDQAYLNWHNIQRPTSPIDHEAEIRNLAFGFLLPRLSPGLDPGKIPEIPQITALRTKPIGPRIQNITQKNPLAIDTAAGVDPRLIQRLETFKAWKATKGYTTVTMAQFRRFMGAHRPNSKGITLYGESTGFAEWSRKVESIHGNTVGNQLAWLYRLETSSGNFLKWGVSADPSARYPANFLEGKRLIPVQQGPRSSIIELERLLIESYPGSLNFEPWAGNTNLFWRTIDK